MQSSQNGQQGHLSIYISPCNYKYNQQKYYLSYTRTPKTISTV